MNRKEPFKAQSFDILLNDFKGKILAQAHGNYTKSYESYKRITNTEIFFKEALRGNHHLTVLDVGCGDGYHLFVFNTINKVTENVRFYGIDTSKWRVEFASHVCRELDFRNIYFLVGSAETLPFPDCRFDIVLCSDVVEHLSHSERCFIEMVRILKPGGIAIVTTPNATSRIQWIIRLLNKHKIQKGAEDNDHISLKGVHDWIDIARAAGFIVSKVKRGALIFGGTRYNRYPSLFAVLIFIDRLFDLIPFCTNWGEAITLKLLKSRKV